MKKLLATTLCALPLALASTAYAASDSAPAPATSTAPASGSSSGTSAASGGMASPGAAPAAGGATTPGMTGAMKAPAEKPHQTVSGWSVKDKIMGTAVYNEKKEKVGDIDDVILKQDGKAVYFVVGAGGFLGMGQHDVAIPFDKITKTGDKLILQGYTKDQLKAMPEVKVAPK